MMMKVIISFQNEEPNIGSDTPIIRPVPPPPGPSSKMKMIASNDDGVHERELPRINPPRPVPPPGNS
jgi:hypothetical protein